MQKKTMAVAQQCPRRTKAICAGMILIFLMAGKMAFAQTLSNLVVQVVKVAANQPAVISWSSETNAIYEVDYSPDLVSAWTIAAQDIGNQGTNTMWADTGTESSFYPRVSSSDTNIPYRFYRIKLQAYASNSFPAAITVSNVSDGATLAGLTNIGASVSTPSNATTGHLLLDGNLVAFGSGTNYIFQIDTRFYPNGLHRMSVSVADDGDSGTTGGDDPVPDPSTSSDVSYATTNLSVGFSNLLSDVHIKYTGYRPDLGQIQEIYGTFTSSRNWEVDITPFNDTNTIYTNFTGSGSYVFVQWNGLDSSGAELDPQRLNYVVYDLGPSTSGDSMAMARFSTVGVGTTDSSWLWVQPSDGSSAPVPSALFPSGFDLSSFVQVDAPSEPSETESFSRFSPDGGFSPDGSSGTTADPVIVSGAHKLFGSFGCLFQGDHSLASVSRPQRGLPFGQVTFTPTTNPLWGKLKSVYKIANYLGSRMPMYGYTNSFIYSDDQFQAAALQKSSLGGSNIFNTVNLALFMGHSAACKENIVALGHPQTYIPIYNSVSGACAWVGMNDMSLGSSSLKWAAFYSCNLFRDSMYRANGCYAQMKNNNHLAMKSSLHIMQAYATEVTVRHDMGEFWSWALAGGTANAADSTVLGAWKYVCLQTQPIESAGNANVSRSIYWEECAGDHIYGYGSQTDPDPGNTQADLLEDDQVATSH